MELRAPGGGLVVVASDFDQIKAEYNYFHRFCKPVTEPEFGHCAFPLWWAEEQTVFGDVNNVQTFRLD